MWEYQSQLRFGNPESPVGLITLWTQQEEFNFVPTNLYHVMGNLYDQKGGGLNVLLRNILRHPQISVLVVTGEDKSGSFRSLLRWKVTDTSIPQNLVDKVREDIRIIYVPDYHKELISTLQAHQDASPLLDEPIDIPVPTASFSKSTYPSEIGYLTRGRLEVAWLDALSLVFRYGTPKESRYGQFFDLPGLVTVVRPSKIWRTKAPFTPEELEQYIQGFWDLNKEKHISYTYGERIFWDHGSSLIAMEEVIQRNPDARHSVLSLWQPEDIKKKSAPCLTEIQLFTTSGSTLNLRASFRSQDMYGGYPLNVAALQHFLENRARILSFKPGKVITFTTSAHYYERNQDDVFARLLTKRNSDLYTNDFYPDKNGNVIITYQEDTKELVATLKSQGGQVLDVFYGDSPENLLRQLVEENILSYPGHWAWLGTEIQKVWDSEHFERRSELQWNWSQ